MSRSDPDQARARELCAAAGIEPREPDAGGDFAIAAASFTPER